MQELSGKIIKKIEISEDNESIVFTTKDKKEFAYDTYGDCCSYSWFAHISSLKSLLENLIIDVNDSKHLPTQEEAEREPDQIGKGFDSLALYGYDLYTEKGVCTIEFRNDSNGYYGGSCKLGKRSRTKVYREVVEDF